MSTPEQLGYSETDGVVTLRMTCTDHDRLIMCLGVAAAHPDFRVTATHLANRMNLGRSLQEWQPYEIPDEVDA